MIPIYGVPLSVHTRKTLMTARHKQIEYTVEVVIPVLPGQPPADWRDKSPTGLIPVMQDGDFMLADSTAICLYLDKKEPAPAVLPTDAQRFARTLWFDAYAGGTVFREVVHPLFHQTVVAPKIRKVPTEKAVVERVLLEAVPKIFGYLESQVEGRFLVGDKLSLADMAIGSNFLVYQYCGFTIDARRFPRLARYLREIVGHELFQAALIEEAPFVDSMGLTRDFLS